MLRPMATRVPVVRYARGWLELGASRTGDCGAIVFCAREETAKARVNSSSAPTRRLDTDKADLTFPDPLRVTDESNLDEVPIHQLPRADFRLPGSQANDQKEERLELVLGSDLVARARRMCDIPRPYRSRYSAGSSKKQSAAFFGGGRSRMLFYRRNGLSGNRRRRPAANVRRWQ